MASCRNSIALKAGARPGRSLFPLFERTIEEFLDEISENHAATAVEVNTIDVEFPAIHLGHLVEAAAEHELTKRITLKWQETKRGERATMRGDELFVEALVKGKVADVFSLSHVLDDLAILLKEHVQLVLNWVGRVRVLSHLRPRRQRHRG